MSAQTVRGVHVCRRKGLTRTEETVPVAVIVRCVVRQKARDHAPVDDKEAKMGGPGLKVDRALHGVPLRKGINDARDARPRPPSIDVIAVMACPSAI